jgi:hypothetical protein
VDLGVDRPVPAVVAIDLHRGHLDPAVATMPLAADRAERVVAANARFFRDCRTAGIPIMHRGDFLALRVSFASKSIHAVMALRAYRT